jgi:hypothetical protein
MRAGHDRAAGWLAIAAAVAGVGAAVAILLPGLSGDVPHEASRAVETSAAGETGVSSWRATGSEGPGGGPIGRTVRAWDAGLGPEAGAGLEALAETPHAPAAERPDPARFRRSPEELAAARAEAERVAATLTPEQRYEAQAFFHDLLILRADALRTQIDAARQAGDERALRRLEPALAIVNQELARAAERTRALEAELGRAPAAPDEAGHSEPAAPEGEDRGAEAEGPG